MVLLTSGNTEMLLFSRFSSSSSRHLANDLGMADSLLYLRPRRLMLARLPTTTRQKKMYLKLLIFTETQIYLLADYLGGGGYKCVKTTNKDMTMFLFRNFNDSPMVSGRSKSSLCCKSRLVICVQFPISFGRCSNWLWATSKVIRLHSSPAQKHVQQMQVLSKKCFH